MAENCALSLTCVIRFDNTVEPLKIFKVPFVSIRFRSIDQSHKDLISSGLIYLLQMWPTSQEYKSHSVYCVTAKNHMKYMGTCELPHPFNTKLNKTLPFF